VRGLGRAARTDEYWNLGVMKNIVAHTAKERTSNGIKTTCANHDQLSLLGLGHVDDALAGVLARLTTHLVSDLNMHIDVVSCQMSNVKMYIYRAYLQKSLIR